MACDAWCGLFWATGGFLFLLVAVWGFNAGPPHDEE